MVLKVALKFYLCAHIIIKRHANTSSHWKKYRCISADEPYELATCCHHNEWWRAKQKALMFSGETTSWNSSSLFAWGTENQQSKLSNWMWKTSIFLFGSYLCLHISFEDVSSTVMAGKAEFKNTLQCCGEGKLTGGFVLFSRCCFKIKCLDSFVFFSFTQRQCETMHLRISRWTPIALKRSIFDLSKNMDITIWRKKKKTLCVESSMDFITAVCVQIEWEEHSWPVDPKEATFLVERVSYHHSIYHMEKTSKQTNKQKYTKEIH